MINKFQKFQKIPLLLSIVFLIFSSGLFFFLHRAINSNNTSSENSQIAWQLEANKRSQLQSLQRSLKDIESERTQLDSHFIKSTDVVPFLDMVEKSATTVGATSEVSLVDIPKDNSGLVVETHVTGKFESVYKYLTLLENSSYELDFISIDMQQSASGDATDKSGGWQWSAIIRVKLLSFLQ